MSGCSKASNPEISPVSIPFELTDVDVGATSRLEVMNKVKEVEALEAVPAKL